MNGARLTTYLLLREEAVRCCEARGVVHERPGGRRVSPMEGNSFWQKGAKGKGSKEKNDRERMAGCYNCGKKGHCSRDSWHPRKGCKDKGKCKRGKEGKDNKGKRVSKGKGGNKGKGKDTKDANALEDPWQDSWQDPWPVWNNAKAGEEQNFMDLTAWDPVGERDSDGRQWIKKWPENASCGTELGISTNGGVRDRNARTPEEEEGLVQGG